MAYLYTKDTKENYGAYSYTIQRKAGITSSQESNRFKRFLDELCELSCLTTILEETGGERSRIKYVITEKGKKTIDLIRNPLIQGLIGAIDKDEDKYRKGLDL